MSKKWNKNEILCLLARKNMTQRDLARKLQTPESNVSRWINGISRIPNSVKILLTMIDEVKF